MAVAADIRTQWDASFGGTLSSSSSTSPVLCISCFSSLFSYTLCCGERCLPSREVGTQWEELKCSQVTGLSKCVPRLCRWLIPGYIGTIGSRHHPVNAVIGGASPGEAANLQWHPCTRRTDAQTPKCSALGLKHLFWKGPPTGSRSDCIRQTCGGSSRPPRAGYK